MMNKFTASICMCALILSPAFAEIIDARSPIEQTQKTTQHAVSLPKQWSALQPIMNVRVNQKKAKMKLNKAQSLALSNFLSLLSTPTPRLLHLQTILPKTTLELLRSVESRGVSLNEAEKMAEYLDKLIKEFKFRNIAAFDENTSHIIGREWSEIDYSGEHMTWQKQKQKQKYKPYGVENFKSEKNLIKFFAVESRLPYFNKIYKPR